MKVTLIDIAALFGAAAWLPHILSWIYKWLSKPVLNLFSAPTIQIGYTNLGPIIHFTGTVVAKRKDAIVDKMTIKVVHEKGDSRTLTWGYLSEIQQQITSPTGISLEVSKGQLAIALKVSVLSPIDKVITFVDFEYWSTQRQHVSRVMDAFSYLEKSGEDKPLEALKKRKEVLDWIDYCKNSMYWKEGKYQAIVELTEVTSKSRQIEKFEFSLVKHEVEMLYANLGLIENNIIALAEPQIDDKKQQPIIWVWAYPEVKRIS